ncbi:proline dehydrogenase family protein [Cryptosporangium aurantiacum]|uniref:proline dehydrogenase n=1 Tax=Cryptosporangium aurantiacum TaxID=134849 RepID=A0A1M7RHE1_9ACTN|nr:proline dehydrogenase family protein [Cryptosporangium aurantiacum]SHN45636.1 L-proline dehydrogenase [Cryptosporangium aurantiacum]
MLRTAILAAARTPTVERLVTNASVARSLVARYVAGDEATDAVRISRELIADGLTVTLDHLGEDTEDEAGAAATTAAYCGLLDALATAGVAPPAEVSVKLSAVGQRLDAKLATENARKICQAAAAVGTTVTLDMEDHTTTDLTLDTLAALRADYPSTGAVLQAYLRRTETDCRDLAYAGSRVRLCKGAYAEPESVGFENALDVDRSYVRCLNVLMAGDGYPMLATHDPRLVAIGEERARWYDRTPDTFEFQMLHGVRTDEQRRLARYGYTVRIYVPYGRDWYPYLMRRLAERPAYLALFARSLVSSR